ncbi:MAG: hypothetical protein ABSD46_09790 [Bacteroidota bacterium]
MSNKLIIVIFLILSYGCISFSQDSSNIISFEPHHLFTLSSGISSHIVRDEMMSLLLYRGTQAPLAFLYRFRGIENRHTVLFYYDYTELNSSITKIVNEKAVSHYINNLHLNFEYSFSTRAAVFEDLHTTCFLGARLSSILNLRDHCFEQNNSQMSAELMTGLGICLLTETAIQKESNNYLRVEVNIPCISYVLLPEPYNAKVSENFSLFDIDPERNILWQIFKKGDFVSFNKLFEMQADFSYIFFVSRYIGFDLHYRFQYYSFTQYQDLFRARVLNNQFLLGLTVKL